MRTAAVWNLVLAVALLPFWPNAATATPLVVISITGGSAQTICDTGNLLDCVTVTEGDLLLCRPTSTGGSGEITGCDWSILFDGDDSAVDDSQELNQQMRGLMIAPNGALVFVVAGSDTIPGGFELKDNDITVFTPNNVLKPFVGGGAYATADGVFKTYLNGALTQQDVSAKPWDALHIVSGGQCEDSISAVTTAPHTCSIFGSLTGGSGTGNFGGIQFANEDIIRCVPTAFATNGAVEACDYSVLLDASGITIGGVANGITSDIEAIDIVSFDPDTMQTEMVFLKKSGSPPDFPAHEPGRDLLTYEGRLGSGLCVSSLEPCAGDADCPSGETCNTGSCNLGAAPCATDEDCSGAGNFCVYAVSNPYEAQVSLFFDGSAVGLSGLGQKIEAFALISDGDGDGIPDGVDNCPAAANAPSVCDGPGSETCPGGLSSECPVGETCVQADSDSDGVGDACDQCNGRDDAVCYCGDNILDIPSEQCDLGSANNGQLGSPCSATCTISGTCKGAGTPCATDTECPAGQGCCGNNITEGNEACDDGNQVNNDLCTTSCDAAVSGTEIVGCDDLTGPNVLPAFVKITKFRDTPDFADIDRWKTKGEAIFTEGVVIDPDTQSVTVTYNNTPSGVLFTSQLDTFDCPQVPCFLQSGTLTKPKWKFLRKEADLGGAPSWRKGKFTTNLNKVKFTLDGRNLPLFTLAEAGSPTPSMRQTIRVGDVCITSVISCEVKSGGKTLKCASVP